MGVTVTLTDLENLNNQTTAVSTINNNSATITTGFTNAVDINGDTLLGDLDMNSNQIYNLPAPSSTSSPMRLMDVELLNGDGTIEAYPLPAGGTSGQVLTKVDSTNYNVEWSVAPSIAGGSTGELGVYTSSTSIGGDANANISNGALTLGQAGSVQGSLTLAGGTSGSSTIAFPATTTGTITFPTGTTNFTSTGGTSQVLQQTSEGEAITVGQLAASNLSNGTTGTGAVVLAAAPTITGNPTFTGSPTIDGSNVITLANIVKEPNGYSLLGNPNSTASNYSSFQIGSLTQKVSPTSLDLLLIADEANSGALKYSTIGEVIGSTITGVTSVNSETGAITITDNGGISLVSSGSNIGLSSAGGLLNKLRNGTFDIWQRGTSGTVSTSNSYSADGWITLATGANGTWAQASNSRTNANTLYGLQLTGASSVTDILVQQRIESYLAVGLAGRNVTFQAWVYNNTGGSITPKLSTQYAGSQDVWTSPSNDLSATNLQACTNAAWTQVAYTLAVSASANNGYAFVIDFGNNFSTTGKDVIIAEASVRVTSAVSTGLNSNPPPAELRFVQNELSLCQRYYTTSYGNLIAPGSSTTNGVVLVGTGYTTVYGIGRITFPVNMRVSPTYSYWDTLGNSSKFSTYQSGSLVTNVSPGGSASVPLYSGTSGVIIYPNIANFGVICHYSASAEL